MSKLFIVVAIFLAGINATHAATDTWTNTGGSNWSASTNWSAGVPGTTDVALFGANPTGNLAGTINFASGTTNNGANNQAVGAIELSSVHTKNVVIGSSATTSGTLTFNGAVLNGVNDVVLDDEGTGNLTIGSSGTIAMALGDTTNNVILQNNSGTITVSTNIGQVTSGAQLTIQGGGSGTVSLTGSNSFSGGLFILGTELDVSGDSSLGALPGSPTADITINGGRLGTNSGTNFTISSNRTILLGSAAGTSISTKGSDDIIYDGSLQDLNGSTQGILVKQGGGTLELGGVNTYSGQTSINNGTLQLDAGNNRLPTGTVVNIGQSASVNLGILNLNGNNQTIAGLTSTVGSNATASKNTITSGSAATLTINTGSGTSYAYGDGSTTNSGVITGAVSVVKMGSGTQSLGDVNSYTGTTTINGGVLNISGSGSLGNTAVTLNNAGSTLSSGTGNSIGGIVTANNGTIIAPGGGGTVSTLTLGGLTMNNGSSLSLDIASNSSFSQILLGSGTLTLAGTDTINLQGIASTGTYTLLSYGTLASGSFTLGTTLGGLYNYAITTGGTTATLTITNQGHTLTWNTRGASGLPITDGSGTWSNGSANFYDNSTSSATTWSNSGSNALTIGNGGAGGIITLSGSVSVLGNLTFAAVTAPYTISGSGANKLTLAGGITANNSATINAPVILSGSQIWNVASSGTLAVGGNISETGGPSGLTKAGLGTLALSGSNSYSGGTTISAGILNIISDTNLGNASGGVTINGGGTLQTGSGITSARSIALGAGIGTFDTNGFNSTLSGTISGLGTLSVINPGTLTLSASNSYSGGTQITGSATVSISNDNQLGAANGTLTVDSSGTLSISGAVTSQRVFTSGSNGATIATNGNNFTNSGTNIINGNFFTSGSGNVTLGGNLSFGGGGVLNIGTGGSITLAPTNGTVNMNSGGVFNGNLIINSASRFNFNNPNGGAIYGGSGNIEILGSSLGGNTPTISGGAFLKSSAVISNVSGTNGGLITSNIILNPAGAGNVAFTPGNITTANYTPASFVSFIGATTGGSIFVGDGSGNGVISGNGDLFIGNSSTTGGGAGTLYLNAQNTYTGNTLINSNGTIVLGGGSNTLPTNTNVIYGSLSGAGNATLDLSGNNQQIASLSDDAAKPSGKNLTITNNGGSVAVLTVSGSVTPANSFSGNIVDGASEIALVKAGSNTLTLNGTDTYSGGTTVLGGTLAVKGSGSLGNTSSSLSVSNGAVDVRSTNQTVGAATLGGGGVIESTGGAGSLTASSLGVSGAGNSIGSGTVTVTNVTTVNSNSSLQVNGTLNGNGGISVSGTLGGSGKVNGNLTVSAGGATYPGDPQIFQQNGTITYNTSSSAQFAIASTRTTDNTFTPAHNVTAGTDYDQIVVANPSLAGSTTLTIQTGVALQLNLSQASFNTLRSNASGNYLATSPNTTLDNYFVFVLGTGVSSGEFATLNLTGLGTSGTDTMSGTILYSGSSDRFNGVSGIGDVVVSGTVNGVLTSQEFALSYNGSYTANSTDNGSDIVLTAIPEPRAWVMIISGFGMLIAFRFIRKRNSQA